MAYASDRRQLPHAAEHIKPGKREFKRISVLEFAGMLVKQLRHGCVGLISESGRLVNTKCFKSLCNLVTAHFMGDTG
jgi:hypothetical protein